MTIESPTFQNNGIIPRAYTCDGGNAFPPLQFSNMPAGAKSLALVIDDPDAPSGTWDHFLAWNIDPQSSAVAEGHVPEGVYGKNSAGETTYYGPCPHNGEHHYIFTLYALDAMLDVPAGSTKGDLMNAMSNHILEQAVLVGRYSRNQI